MQISRTTSALAIDEKVDGREMICRNFNGTYPDIPMKLDKASIVPPARSFGFSESASFLRHAPHQIEVLEALQERQVASETVAHFVGTEQVGQVLLFCSHGHPHASAIYTICCLY